MCKEAGHEGICNKNSITEQLCDNDFINCDGMAEIEDKIDECNEELHQDAALNSTVNTPETTNIKITETFKTDKTSTNIPNTKTNSNTTKEKSKKLQTYEANRMKKVFDETPSELPSDDFYKTKKKRETSTNPRPKYPDRNNIRHTCTTSDKNH